MHIRDDNLLSCHDRAVQATRSNVAHVEQRLEQLEHCLRVLLRDREFLSLLHELGYSRLPRHVHDVLK
jgi:hypothetical protein